MISNTAVFTAVILLTTLIVTWDRKQIEAETIEIRELLKH
jgi:hypothetical protein